MPNPSAHEPPPTPLHAPYDLLEPLRRPEQAVAEALIGYRFNHAEWLTLALTHSSATTANGLNNERIEFLGDSILGLVVAEHLVRTQPGAPEGDLTRYRSMVVNTHTLAKVMRGMIAFMLDGEYREAFGSDGPADAELVHDAHDAEEPRLLRRVSMRSLLRLGRGIPTNKELPSRIWANMFEAIVGAIYLDAGLPEARSFVMRMLEGPITSVSAPGIETNHKSLLQHITQKFLAGSVRYQVTGQSGPDHEKVFEIQVKIQDRGFAPARGKSKREAEQAAACLALNALAADWERYVTNGLAAPQELSIYAPGAQQRSVLPISGDFSGTVALPAVPAGGGFAEFPGMASAGAGVPPWLHPAGSASPTAAPVAAAGAT
ncbi:MAG: ribonuclease III family protein, partial [Planctomycetota bacterium]